MNIFYATTIFAIYNPKYKIQQILYQFGWFIISYHDKL